MFNYAGTKNKVTAAPSIEQIGSPCTSASTVTNITTFTLTAGDCGYISVVFMPSASGSDIIMRLITSTSADRYLAHFLLAANT